MSYATDSFDVVVDKSLLDFLIYTGRDEQKTVRMLSECGRVTRPGGTCLFLSWCPPKEMSVHLSGCAWDVDAVVSTELEARCDEQGRVPYDAPVELDLGAPAEDELRTNFYLYMCTVLPPKELGQPADDLAEQGEFEAAIEAFGSQLQQAPCDVKIHEAMAQCYLMLDEPQQVRHAVLLAARATLLDPSWACGQLTLARAHLACSNFGLAVVSFRKAIELDPELTAEVAEDLQVAEQQFARRQQAAMLRCGHNQEICPPCPKPRT